VIVFTDQLYPEFLFILNLPVGPDSSAY